MKSAVMLLLVLVILALCQNSSSYIGQTNDVVTATPRQTFIREFPLGAVKLADGPFARAEKLNREYLLMIDPDSLLNTFRDVAGLPHSAPVYLGWEAPGVEVRGEFTGHYLSATALCYNYTGDEAVQEKATYLVKELKKVQDAIGTGYLSGFPVEHFDRLQSLQPVWAPFYCIHKIMTGLLDQYTLAGQDLALSVVLDMADFFTSRVDEIIRVNGTARWHETLEVEFGGMQEIYTRLWALTGTEDYLRTADLFVKGTWFNPLADDKDVLADRHANTHLAQVNAFAVRHELPGDDSSLAATSNFFDYITTAHSFASGGSNNNEFWGPALQLGDAIDQAALNTQETCTTYNILKIARGLFRWTGNVKYADFYERALWNGIVGTQRMPPRLPDRLHTPHMQLQGSTATDARRLAELRAKQMGGLHSAHPLKSSHLAITGDTNKPGPGVLLYHTPMGASGKRKADNFHGWGHTFSSFWCCYGTSIESFAKLADFIFFWRNPVDQPPVLYINQLVSSELTWDAMGMRVALDASVDDDVATTLLTFVDSTSPNGIRQLPVVNLKIRVPSWTDREFIEVSSDGRPITCTHETVEDKGYCSIIRNLRSGQQLQVRYKMEPYVVTLQDSRPVFQVFKAVMMGPHLMAGLTHDSRVITADPKNIKSLVSPVSSKGHLSLAPSWAPPGVYLRHDRGSLYSSEITDGGDALDATFRFLPGLALKNSNQLHRDFKRAAMTLEVLPAQLHRSSRDFPQTLVSLEPVASPKALLSFDHPTWLQRQSWAKAEAVFSTAHQGRKAQEAHTFVLRPGLSNETGTVSLELYDKPGTYLVTEPPEDHHDHCDNMAAADCGRGGSLTDRWACGKSCAQHDPKLNRLRADKAPSPGSTAAEHFAHAASFRVEPPRGQWPEGSMLLHGDVKDFIISPLANIVDERYTAYFEWYQPPRWSWMFWFAVPFVLVACCAMLRAFCGRRQQHAAGRAAAVHHTSSTQPTARGNAIAAQPHSDVTSAAPAAATAPHAVCPLSEFSSSIRHSGGGSGSSTATAARGSTSPKVAQALMSDVACALKSSQSGIGSTPARRRPFRLTRDAAASIPESTATEHRGSIPALAHMPAEGLRSGSHHSAAAFLPADAMHAEEMPSSQPHDAARHHVSKEHSAGRSGVRTSCSGSESDGSFEVVNA